MAATSKENVREAILAAAREAAMAYGYGGLNFRDLAETVGIKAASINYYFANKALLGEAVARRYWEDIARDLEDVSSHASSPTEALRRYPGIFRLSLARDNRMCLSSFMATEYDALPEPVLKEVQAFADVNTAWLRRQLVAAELVAPNEGEARARAVYAAVAGAQIVARSRADITLFDSLIQSYREAGLLPN
ncbi:TetR/AcrR family transcriptional regulator [Methylobacterium sp. HMF5984]|jgi:TetR/AcrR family transcriptional repressor of nem operon|uniref:TetR/AcrR family transcriptional regulator n=1 Tax=unclassified Methylobacterium TaxID=2615210 RepID=UPI001FB929C3|nr:TetR/AcrR family transcriptional regulator [Methylobacterium sp. E-025]MCJ2112570.1 TetR/AcrR family transcriptional regulator [Methylobacterium sp. E-025]